MISSTLKGVFPEPKPTYNRNFVKENVHRIKVMQGIMPSSESDLQKKRKNKLKTNAQKIINKEVIVKKNINNLKPGTDVSRGTSADERPRNKKKEMGKTQEIKQKFLSRGIQTERTDDIKKIYETGKIKYPSAGLQRSPTKMTKNSHLERGDTMSQLDEATQNLALTEKPGIDFVQENIKNIKLKSTRNESNRSQRLLPPDYKKGEVPKYLRERKEVEDNPVIDIDCPPGHVLLPDEERKETLRVLRQTYADRIQELNTFPVRSDTLKTRRRKMEIEAELKKIDEGLKVFQRPKVFVKMNA